MKKYLFNALVWVNTKVLHLLKVDVYGNSYYWGSK